MPKVNLESNAPAVEYRPPGMALAKGATEGFAVEAQGHKQAAQQWGALAEMGAKAFQLGLAREREKESQRAIEADNAYNLRMGKVRQEIFDTMKGSLAGDALAVYEAKEQEAFREIYGASGIKYKAGQMMFENMRMRSLVQNSQIIDHWRSGQLDESALTNTANGVASALNTAMEMGTPDGFRSLVANVRLVTGEGLLRFSPEKQEALARNMMTEAVGGYVTERVKSGDWAGARLALSDAVPFVDRGALAQLEGLVNAYEKASSDLAENARLYDEYGGNLAAALADKDLAQGGVPGEDKIGWTAAPGAKVDTLKPQAKAGLGTVARLLKGLGAPGMYVTSGMDGSHADGEYSHKSGYKVDIGTSGPGQADWFDDPANRKRFVEAAAQEGIVARDEWENTGDANWTGPHMDISFAGYKGGGSFSQARIEERKKSVIAYFENRNRIKAIVIDNVKDKALNQFFALKKAGRLDGKSALDVVSSLVSSASLSGEDRATLERELTALASSAATAPARSDMETWNRLQALSLRGMLAAGDVEAEINAGRLSEDDAKKFLGDALKIKLDEENKPDKMADLAWQAYVKAKPMTGYERDTFIQNMTYILDSDGIKGDERRARAMKAFDDMPTKTFVIKYIAEGAAQRKAGVELFGGNGELISALVAARLGAGKRPGLVSDNSVAAELRAIKALLDEGTRLKDPFYQEALDSFLEKSKPISAVELKALRDFIARTREGNIVSRAGGY
jgi:hypothetical protein